MTRRSAAAAPQNAGGEGGTTRIAAAAEQPSDGGDRLACVLGGAGLLLGAVALAVALRRGRPRAEAG